MAAARDRANGGAGASAPTPAAAPVPGGERRVTLAAITGAHGLGGEVRLKLFTDDAEALGRYRTLDAAGRALRLLSVRAAGPGAIARFEGISDRSAAEALRGTALTVARSELPPLAEGEYYHADLIGLPVHPVDEAGTGPQFGTVVAVENFGAGDVIDIRREDGRTVMAPMHAATLDDGMIRVERPFLES
ncbi:16S rRNA processing protein RimM [Sphingomonas changnyeongensis]|uniref:Ribosome maturation factor RimM n=1 Tax=Sphingomonas changnyeongensis TaxID=2698679 RepID=A0A7Z2S870_9SPHN|nr:ribosome maturation factor RimM [Sphingomonas changnyeongensis]QHL91096.1 16S rRNA processing protein RimM [Sphingomonas changnyeongensis]